MSKTSNNDNKNNSIDNSSSITTAVTDNDRLQITH